MRARSRSLRTRRAAITDTPWNSHERDHADDVQELPPGVGRQIASISELIGLSASRRPTGDDGQDLRGDAGLLRDEPVERALEQPDRDDRGIRDHGRGPRPAVEQRDLARRSPPGPARAIIRLPRITFDLALDDHVERATRLPGLDDRLPFPERDLVRVLRDLLQVTARQPVEQRDLREEIGAAPAERPVAAEARRSGARLADPGDSRSPSGRRPTGGSTDPCPPTTLPSARAGEAPAYPRDVPYRVRRWSPLEGVGSVGA